MAKLTNADEQGIRKEFETILSDSKAMAWYLHANMHNEEREMLMSELESQGFGLDTKIDTIIENVPYEIKMWSGIPVDDWVDTYINEQGEDFTRNRLVDNDNIFDYIMANLHLIEFEISIDITPEEYKDQYPIDDPSLFIDLLADYSFDEIKAVLNNDYYDERVKPDIREQFVEQGFNIEDFDKPHIDVDYDITDVYYVDSYENIAEELSQTAMQKGGVRSYFNSGQLEQDLIDKFFIDFDLDVDFIDNSRVEITINKQLHNQIKNGFIDAFENPSELGEYLKVTEKHFYQIVTNNALQAEGFPVEANYDNTSLIVEITSKIDSEMWAESYIVANDLENEEDDVIQSYAEDRDEMIQHIFEDLQKTNIEVTINVSLEEWYEEFKKENKQEASEVFAESVFEMDMIDFDESTIVDIIKDEYDYAIKDVKHQLGKHAFAPDDPAYDSPVDDESYWDYDLVRPQDTSLIFAYMQKAIVQDGIVDEDALIEACDDGWAETQLVDGDFITVDESPVSTDYSYVIEFVPDE